MSALITTLFLGGWQVPGIGDLGQAIAGVASVSGKALWILLSVCIFFAKTLTIVFVVIWVRWTLPRLRVDQLMVMCWKYLVPIGFVTLMGSAVFAILPQEGAWQLFQTGIRIALTLIGATMVWMLLRQSFRNIRSMKDPIDLKLWE